MYLKADSVQKSCFPRQTLNGNFAAGQTVKGKYRIMNSLGPS